MELKEAFGATLRRLRIKRGLSQEHLALEAEFSRPYVSELERGLKEPSLTTLFRACKGLGIKPSEFISKLEARLK
jgi:transcriptional regulator with XRE-family HTH domain